MSFTIVNFYGYKNLLNLGGASFCSHDGHYSILIKYNQPPLHLNEKDAELAYDHCQLTFFEMVDMITDIFGYKGYAVAGRSGGYIEPLIEGYNQFKPIDAIHDEYLQFDDHIIQLKIDAYAQTILNVKRNIQSIYRHSNSLDEVVDLVDKVFNGVVYV